MALSCPVFFFAIFYFFMPESPRWLLQKGRLDDAKQILEKILKFNGKVWPEGFELKRLEETSV
jgi:OCT family organic cation transporter-like MFS transporter 1